jgi:peroxiredoxin
MLWKGKWTGSSISRNDIKLLLKQPILNSKYIDGHGEKRMSRKQFFVLTILLIVGLVIGHNGMSAYGKSNAPKAAEKTSIDQIKLSAPQSSDLQNYLGVQKDSEFKLTQIRAKLILIEIVDVYCPDCQRNAPQMNRIFNIIENDTELNSDTKIIGIAAGNDSKQTETFVKEFKIRFPVFPDPDNEIHKLLGGTGPPGIIFSDIHGKTLFVHEGVLEDIDFLLEKLREVHRQL